MSRVLITGASGLLGEALSLKLSRAGHEVFALGRRKVNLENCINIASDLTQLDTSGLPENIDYVFHLAQSRKFRNFPDETLDIFNINLGSTIKLIDWARLNNVKGFYYTSSGGVYGGNDHLIDEYFNISLNRKNGFYLDSKLATEVLVRNFSRFFESFVILRPFFMYGPRQDRSMLIPRLVDSVLSEKEIHINKAGGLKINPIHVDDASSLLMKLLDFKGKETINLAGGEVFSLKEIAETISEQVGIQPRFSLNDSMAEDLVADITKMKSIMGEPLKTFRGAVQEMSKSPIDNQ